MGKELKGDGATLGENRGEGSKVSESAHFYAAMGSNFTKGGPP